MREADLARARHRAAADDGRSRGAVVRRAKRRRTDEPCDGKRSRDGMDPRHLERLGARKRREDRRQPSSEHRLPGSRWAREQEVVRACRRDLECTATAFLSADVLEVVQRRLGRGLRRRLRRGDPIVPEEVADSLRQMPHADCLDACERSLLGRVDMTQDAGETRPRRTFGSCDRPGDRADPAVQPQLSDACVLLEALARDLRRRGEHRQRDREIEPRPFLSQRRRREIDRDRALRPFEQRRVDPAPNAMLRLLARTVGEPDDRERREIARAEVCLDLDTPRLEADERERDGAAEHASTVRAKP